MLTKKHATRGTSTIRPSVVAFLQTGDEAVLRQDNPFLTINLIGNRELAAAYARGDLAAVVAQLQALPHGHNFFV